LIHLKKVNPSPQWVGFYYLFLGNSPNNEYSVFNYHDKRDTKAVIIHLSAYRASKSNNRQQRSEQLSLNPLPQ